MNQKNKLNIYLLLIVTLSLAFISTFGFITHKKPKKKVVAHKNHQVIHNLSTFKSNLSTEKTNKRLLLSYKLNTHGKEVIENKVQQTNYKTDYKTITVVATAYTAYCDTGCTGVTYTGVDVSDTVYYHGYRVLAVDPSVVPLYSIVRVQYDDKSFLAIAIDIGSAIQSKRVDILMSTKKKALNFGIRTVTLTILREGRAG